MKKKLLNFKTLFNNYSNKKKLKISNPIQQIQIAIKDYEHFSKQIKNLIQASQQNLEFFLKNT